MESFDLASLLFYVFAAVVSLSAVMVISARNSVHSVFFLILAFFNASGLFVLLGAEYIAMTLVIVYVGAVAVLFLFVVMMLNVNYQRLRAGFLKYLPVGLLVATILFIELIALQYASAFSMLSMASISAEIPDPAVTSNTKAIGDLLYTRYVYVFQLAGLVLLVAMIGAIVLTLRQRPGVKRQRIYKQVNRKREESIELVQVESGKGVRS